MLGLSGLVLSSFLQGLGYMGSSLSWGSRVPFIRVPYYIGDQKGDPNLENYPSTLNPKPYPYLGKLVARPVVGFLPKSMSAHRLKACGLGFRV